MLGKGFSLASLICSTIEASFLFFLGCPTSHFPVVSHARAPLLWHKQRGKMLICAALPLSLALLSILVLELKLHTYTVRLKCRNLII